ncbi:ABC transporter substrate-binding protein [Ligilactobacillus murinus]|uniref:ABC transporter substrate-binding protein n=1 Tax=Ligilactobacillus murinus TaxID=1622 RepID=A0A4Q2ADD1_9LACO|nr:ABC transporter substrate-binding protein [Ligilactobacillus murinus]NBH41738.1 ABC transporter substrate-binding protein [Ligilactobacillus murinus]NBH86586.1 ABC transporter substrate-binding protein [Lachnospiraceae bacterium]RII77893.1 ABC transporter substrate-binding protein [Ligilactobacillus murinus]RXV66851.1 ABC transporter substrate-binding protein [Ligilactobacillus murinus]
MVLRDNDTKFVRQLVNNINANLHVCHLAKVTALNDDRTRASVQPLALNASALLMNVVVGKSAQMFIDVGSVVGVVFLDRSLVNWDGTANEFKLDSERMHNLNDAVVMEVFA